MKFKKTKKFLFIFLITFLFDLLISQLFLLDIIKKNKERAFKENLENRIYNKNYKYTFKENKTFNSSYNNVPYIIHTNNLGFRDKAVRQLDFNKQYSIVIGDSFIEGVVVNYENTIVGFLNENLKEEIKSFEFLNAGVVSYSSYIYLKKIENILTNNPSLNIKDVIIFLDKSDIQDDLNYLEEPDTFKNTKITYVNQRKVDFKEDLIKLDLWRFYTKQTISGSFFKIVGDQLEFFARDIRDKFKLSKKLNKNFFEITKKHTNALRSINNRRHIANYFYGKTWENEGKKSAQFSIKNLIKLNKFLDSKDVGMKVILYPWSFEIVESEPRKNYLKYMEKSLNENNIKYFNFYDLFLTGDVYSNISENFIFNDIHYNSKGNKLLAEALFNKISK